MKNKIGIGKSAPLDTDESVVITLTVGEDGLITSCGCAVEGSAYLDACAGTLCDILPGKPVADVLQMTNMAIVYNMETELPPLFFYCSHMAATAAKNAARDYMNKNGIPYEDTGCCNCSK
ncbi:MAG: iron-sulfur cluster assembly scaffold protein [Clostridia bacterium]|nr:iron-sulfur cluster assembly scaffold protein [Clostridia bacterium]